jgi:hypothetical protein
MDGVVGVEVATKHTTIKSLQTNDHACMKSSHTLSLSHTHTEARPQASQYTRMAHTVMSHIMRDSHERGRTVGLLST